MLGRFRLLSAMLAVSGSSLLLAQTAIAESSEKSHLLLFADRDDDDDDGVADGVQARLSVAAAQDVQWLTARERPHLDQAILSPIVRFVADGRAVPSGKSPPAGAQRIGLQAVAPGRTDVLIGTHLFDVSVVEFAAVDAHGTRVDLSRSHASISRVLPSFLTNDDAGASDQDALRWLSVGEEGTLPEQVDLHSIGAEGQDLDSLLGVELWELPCPPNVEPGLSCRATPLIRATADRIDRGHPESSRRSLRAEVGGRLTVRIQDRKAASIRVGGPRITAIGPIERLRARLNVRVLRTSVGGSPAVGGGDAQALALVRGEVGTASLLWGQCGVHFGIGRDVVVKLVDPPPPYLVAVGCALGLPASGGELRLRVGPRSVRVPTARGESPSMVAEHLAVALRASGLAAWVSPNPRIDPGALPAVDVLVRDGEGWATVERDGEWPTSTDPSLGVCIGGVELQDGLSHFTDANSAAGTLEERTLIKAYADRDPTTIDVFVIPAFSGIGRVGESFLDTTGAGVHNAVIVDRAAILSGARSHVLAHELGHILLNMPGHPDDYGVDQPTALMDSDATDPSIFGPRRLSVEECERAVRERGPGSAVPLLEPWPLFTPAR